MNENLDIYMKYYINKFYLNKLKIKREINYRQIYVTNLCAENCIHCYLKDIKKSEISAEEVIEIIKKFIIESKQEKKKPVIDLIGGDPLLKEGILKILQFLYENKIDYGIKGNAKFINENKENLKIFGVRRYQLSIDGLEEKHDYIRSKGNFEQTMLGIKILNKIDIPVFLKYTVFKDNIDEIPLILKYLYENNFKIAGFSTSRYYEDNLENTLSKEEMKYYMEKSLESYKRLYENQLENKKINIGVIFKEHLWYPYLYEKGYILEETHKILERTPFLITCSMLLDNFNIIECDGKIALCPKIKEINSENYEKMRVKKYKEKLKEKGCLNCRFRKYCLGCPAFYEKNYIDVGCFLHTI